MDFHLNNLRVGKIVPLPVPLTVIYSETLAQINMLLTHEKNLFVWGLGFK